MAKEELHPLPQHYIEDWQDRISLQLGFVPYVWQAMTELRFNFSDIPKDTYVVGDNWLFFIEGREEPRSQGEIALKAKFPNYLFPDVYQIEERGEKDEGILGIGELLDSLIDNVKQGVVPERVLEKIAIIDRTSRFFPVFDEDNVEVLERRPWGRIVRVWGYSTLIYHVQNEVRPKTKIHL